MNKLAFYLSTALAVLTVVFVQDVSSLPFVFAAILTWFNLDPKKKVYGLIFILSVFMFLVNLESSFIDSLVWIGIGVLSYKK